ncbi:MAG: phenylacetate--CoA ligase family protein [Candidatus Omnitrophica bacterium]|nr:phenylacetate--CoA ligase family protein [Candidatus Omnitrophota bacterium]
MPIVKKIKRIIVRVLARLPFSHQIYLLKRHGIKFFVYRGIVRRHERYSLERMNAYQKAKLSKLIRHVYEKVPYYRGEFQKRNLTVNDIQDAEDLAKLPMIDKNFVKDHIELFKADDFKRYHPVEQHTSGSTGRPFKFYVDNNIISFVDALGWRRFNWAGYYYNDPFVIVRQPIGYRSRAVETQKRYFYDPLTKMLETNTHLLNDDHGLSKAFDIIEQHDVSVLITYPSYMFYLSDFARRNNIKMSFKSVISGAEKLYPQHREVMKEVFQANVYDFFGMEERLFYAAQCPKGNMHAFFDSGILEIIKDGRPCRPQEVGEFVVTGLHNYSMPLMRYATGDYGCFLDKQCACGSRMPLIKVVGGGNKDLIVTRSGMRGISPSHAFLENESEKIKAFQIYQDNIDEVVLKIVKGIAYTQDDTVSLEEKYRDLLNNEARVKVVFVDKIEREASGKYRFVLSKVYKDKFKNLA